MSPSSAAVAGNPWRRLIPVFIACAVIGLQGGVAIPLVPLALEQQGTDKFTIGVVTAAWPIGMLVFGSRIPHLAARLGAVPLIVLSVLISSALSVAYTVTSGPVAWFIISLVQGFVGGVPWVVSEIWMNVVVEEGRRGRVMGLYAMLIALGMALGPLLLQVTGVFGPTPFITCAVLLLLVAVPLLPHWRTAPRILHPQDSGFVSVMVGAPLAMFTAFACGVGEHAAFGFLPVYAVGQVMAPETGAFWLSAFVIGNVILQWPIGWAADHADRRLVLVGCTAASALLMVGLPFVPAGSLAVIGVIMLWGGFSFSIYPVGLALLGQRYGAGDMARANTAFSLLYIFGGLVGRPTIGAAMDAVGDGGMGWTLAAFYTAACLVALLAMRDRVRRI